MKVPFGEQLRTLRHRKGSTQEEVAAALDVTPQAVSRWENSSCYPDIELLPAIANYFGVTLDHLFGYVSEREQKINSLEEKLLRMNRENSGIDVSMDECERQAREALREFPGNEKLMQALAEILSNAGYVRYGEHHIKDADGYNVLDTERHRQYAEWQEAIPLYEALLPRLEAGERRWRAVRELTDLYALTGQEEKAAALVENAPDLTGCRELLRLNALSGKRRAEAYRQAVLALAAALAQAMVQCLLGENTPPASAAKRVEEVLSMLEQVGGNGFSDPEWLHSRLAHIHLFLADRRWTAGNAAGAFDALNTALKNAAACSPALAASLPEDYPWWNAIDSDRTIQQDPRWREWVERAKAMH